MAKSSTIVAPHLRLVSELAFPLTLVEVVLKPLGVIFLVPLAMETLRLVSLAVILETFTLAFVEILVVALAPATLALALRRGSELPRKMALPSATVTCQSGHCVYFPFFGVSFMFIFDGSNFHRRWNNHLDSATDDALDFLLHVRVIHGLGSLAARRQDPECPMAPYPR